MDEHSENFNKEMENIRVPNRRKRKKSRAKENQVLPNSGPAACCLEVNIQEASAGRSRGLL